MSRPRLRPFFSFFGSKWRLAPRYPPPEYGRIIEPFAGSAGYSLLYPDRRVTLVDKDPIVAAVWRYLLRVSATEIDKLPRLEKGEYLPENLPQEARWLIGFWIRQSAVRPGDTRTGFSDKFASGPCEAYIRRVSSQLEYIRHWRIHEMDYLDCPDIAGTWFVDPPYVRTAHEYVRTKGLNYLELARWCRSRTGQIIVCENANAGWLDFCPLVAVSGMARQPGGQPPRSMEAVWIHSSLDTVTTNPVGYSRTGTTKRRNEMPRLDTATARVVNKAEGSSFTLLDEDLYLLKLTKCVVSTKPDRNGNTYWIWSWEVSRGQTSEDKFKGKSVRCNTGFTEDQAWFPKSIFDAFGVKPNVDTDTLLGKEVVAIASQREIGAGPRKGQLTNDLGSFASASTFESGDSTDEFADDTTDAASGTDDEEDIEF
jgi:hypothetical protein